MLGTGGEFFSVGLLHALDLFPKDCYGVLVVMMLPLPMWQITAVIVLVLVATVAFFQITRARVQTVLRIVWRERWWTARMRRRYWRKLTHYLTRSKDTIPLRVNNHFLRACNYACGFCFHQYTSKTVMSLDEAIRGLRLLEESGMEKINFSGGEVCHLLYGDKLNAPC